MEKIKFLLLIVIISLKWQETHCQKSNQLTKTTEKIVNYNFEIPISKGKNTLINIGIIRGSIVYKYEDYTNWEVKFYKLNEDNYTFKRILGSISNSKRSFSFNAMDSMIFYSKAVLLSNNNLDFNYLVLEIHDKIYFLDSISNSDKKIHSSFSQDGKILIVNTLNTLLDYYNPEQDDRFMVYHLENINKGIIKKEYIACTSCADGYLVGNDLFFTKSNQRDDFTGGFAWKDIYKAPWGKLQDSVKIAAFSEILVISPDGKYILGTRHFDLPNNPCAIFDVENKKYQLLLGRDYSKAHAFYSYKEKKFAFDFGGYIVYVDFPEVYPFDALRKDNPDIPNWSDREFYNRFEHPPFKKIQSLH